MGVVAEFSDAWGLAGATCNPAVAAPDSAKGGVRSMYNVPGYFT